MPRVSKRKLQSKVVGTTGGYASALAAHRRENWFADSGYKVPDSESDGEIYWSDEDQIGQPANGWSAAERNISKRHWGNLEKATVKKQSSYYYRKKELMIEEERVRLQETYGSITRFFNSPAQVIVDDLEPLQLFIAPDFNQSLPQELLENEIKELNAWVKKFKPEGAWAVRVDGLMDLLNVEIRRGQITWVNDSIVIAASKGKGTKWAKSLRRWHRDWQQTRTPPPKMQKGYHMKAKTLFYDEGIKIVVREYLNTAMSKANAKGICDAVGKFLEARQAADIMRISTVLNQSSDLDAFQPLSALNNNPNAKEKTIIGHRTARRWLARVGWIYSRNKKGYVDGHEREDVVAYRTNIFIPRWKMIETTLREFDDGGEIIKPLAFGTRRRILVTHDESTFNSNDANAYSWKPKNQEWLRPKSRGKGLMVSEFLTEAGGRLSYFNSESGQRNYALEVIKYGNSKNDDGWWDSERMVKQVLEKAIPIFEQQYPNDIAVFAFDNSSGHACKAPDALVASRMNLNPGGKQPKMHSTYFSNGIYQTMIFTYGDFIWDTNISIPSNLIGQAKGMKRVLQERGLWREGLLKQCGSEKRKQKGLMEETEEERELRKTDECVKGNDCCALRILENQEDFANEKSLLELEIVKRGHEVIFYPKFHCELNYIEYFWAAVKKYTRENCSYSFTELEETVLDGLESVSLKTIRRFANRSKRWIRAYAEGLSREQHNYAEQQYRSHRREYRRDLT